MDEVEATPAGGANLVTNGGFESGLGAWLVQGTHKRSVIENSGFAGGKSLRLVATGRGDPSPNHMLTVTTTPGFACQPQYKNELADAAWTQVLDHKQLPLTNQITDISMDGCTLQTTGFSKGAFIELILKPTVEEDTIRVETAMVCSVRPLSVGIRFLEIPPEQYRRLAQVVLGLLVGQGLGPTFNA